MRTNKVKVFKAKASSTEYPRSPRLKKNDQKAGKYTLKMNPYPKRKLNILNN